MRLSEKPLVDQEAIAEAVTRLGREISERHAGRDELVLVVVLKGGTLFAADLMRQLDLPLSVEYIRAKSYDGIQSLGDVDLPVLPDQPLTGKHLLVVEDILDTGRTTAAILKALTDQHPASLELCVLLDKPSRRVLPVTPHYVGFTIDDHFVVGYGLDYDERYRHLPAVYVLENHD